MKSGNVIGEIDLTICEDVIKYSAKVPAPAVFNMSRYLIDAIFHDELFKYLIICISL